MPDEDNYIEEEIIFEDDQEEALLIVAAHRYTNRDNAFWEALREYFEPKEPRKRRLQALPRPYGSLWTAMEHVWPRLPKNMLDEKHREHLRLSKAGYEEILSKIEAALTHDRDSRGRKGIPPRAAFAATLRWLAGGASLAEVCDQFCMAKSTLKKWLKKVIDALYDHLVPEQIIFPTGDELKKTMVDFEKRCSLPLVAGAIDGTFIEMVRPSVEFADSYWCYKNLTGILCLAVVDAVGRFTFVDVGRPASVGDAFAFQASDLKACLDNETVLPPNEGKEINGVHVRPYLLGDAAFPSAPYLMKCYGNDPREESAEGKFNRAVINGRRVVEMAFGRLKARWRVLKKTDSNDPEFMAKVTTVCCALHNYCESERLRMFNISDIDAWELDELHGGENGVNNNNNRSRMDANNIRDVLRDHVFQQVVFNVNGYNL